MKLHVKITISLVALTSTFSCTSKHAFVTFTGDAPVKYEHLKQAVTLYACNGTKISHKTEWKKENQKKIPFGHQVKDGKDFFISKYYVASPPLPDSFGTGRPLVLGVLSKDHFTLEKPTQNVDVFMDYNLLKPIQLGLLSVNYSNTENGDKNCISQDINTIPINIRCPSFKYVKGQKRGLGKGIAQLTRVKSKEGHLTAEGQLFIPLELESAKPLENCTVEILNDIILERQIYFGTAENHQEKLDLTQAYKNYKLKGEHVNLYCRARHKAERAAGCEPSLP